MREAAASIALDGDTYSVDGPPPEPEPPCQHRRTNRDKAASGGYRTICLDCGTVTKVG